MFQKRTTVNRNKPQIPEHSPNLGLQLPQTLARTANIVEEQQKLSARGRAIMEAASHKGFNEVVDISGVLEDVQDTGAGLSFTLVDYKVPPGQVARIEYLGVYYSNPVVPSMQSVGWRIMVNGKRLDNVVDSGNEYFYWSFGSISDPMKVQPIFVQSGQTIKISVTPRFLFNSKLLMIGRLSGRLYKPATPELP